MAKIYFPLVLIILLIGCKSSHILETKGDLLAPSQFLERQPSAETNENKNAFTSFFNGNYINRLKNVGRLALQSKNTMSFRGHPRKYILEQFLDDLNKQISTLSDVEDSLESLESSWLPKPDSTNYDKKMESIEVVIQSAKVMKKIDAFAMSSQIINDEDFEKNIFAKLLYRAVDELETNFKRQKSLSSVKASEALKAYVNMISATALNHLPRPRDLIEKNKLAAISVYLKQLPTLQSESDAKILLSGKEYELTKDYFSNSDTAGESEIEGFEEVQKNKIATYFGLLTIKFLYTNPN